MLNIYLTYQYSSGYNWINGKNCNTKYYYIIMKGGIEMKRKWFTVLTVVMMITSILMGSTVMAKVGQTCNKGMDPIVSTDWLQTNSDLSNLVILDVRTAAEYGNGHIKNSINVPLEVPFSAWLTMMDDLLFELPDTKELFEVIGDCGITKASNVVVVTSLPAPGELPYCIANATRVADTLIYAGVKNVALLDGGYTKWAAEGKEVTTIVPTVKKTVYRSVVNRRMFVSIDTVKNQLGKSVIIDARDSGVYSGAVIEPYANKAGHIPTAKSMPTVSLWNEDGTYKSVAELRKIANQILVSNDKVIVYCGVGGYASTVWYVLTQVLGYNNVSYYDGSAQEWVKYYDMELN